MADIVSNLKLAYDFRDGSGTTVKDSAGTYNGTTSGTPTWVTPKGLTFVSGSSQYVNCGAPIHTITGGATEFTIALQTSLANNNDQMLWGNISANSFPQFSLSSYASSFYLGYLDPSSVDYRTSIAWGVGFVGAQNWYVSTFKVGEPTRLYSNGALIATAGANFPSGFTFPDNLTVNGTLTGAFPYSSNTTYFFGVWARKFLQADVVELIKSSGFNSSRARGVNK